MEILIAIASFAVGAVAVWLVMRAHMQADRRVAQQQHDTDRAAISRAEAALEAERKNALDERDRILREADDRRRESDALWEARLEALKKELIAGAAQQLTANDEHLRRSNSESIGELLKPVKEQFEEFRKAVSESARISAASKQEIQDKFEATLKLFAQQQAQAVAQLRDQTERIGSEAVSLAKALKGDTKRQGNWGEMVLQTMLENSGLEEGVNFFRQYAVTDEDGRRSIPDVVVKLPDERSVIIDSKVSLTAYTQYFETDDDDRREHLLKEHLNSVLRHIDELSVKNYPRVVENSLDFVLMFIPNESSYVAAIRLNPDLLHLAFRKKVLVISPNSLLMTLQIAHNLWQNDRQLKNVDKIVARGKALYDKVVDFQRTFDSISTHIDRLRDAYDNASRQLTTGRGNVLRQCEMLTELGVSPDKGKRLALPDTEEEA